MKTIALVLIFSVCSLTGIYKSLSLSARCRELERAVRAVERIGAGISGTRCVCGDLLRGASEESGSRLFSEVSGCLTDSPRQAFEDADLSGTHLSADDLKTAEAFFANFGRTGSEDQIRLCRRISEEFGLRLDSADSDRKKYSKLWAEGGVLVGLFIVILLI